MKLTRVEIENFRCFEQLTVSLEPDVTAVIGINAAGKTALLDGIALLLLPLFEDIARRQPNAGTLDFPTFYRHFAGAAIDPADIRLNAPGRVDREREQALALRAQAVSQEGQAEPPVVLAWQIEAAVTRLNGTSRYSQRWLSPDGLATANPGLYLPGDIEGAPRHIGIPALAYYRDTRDSQFLRQATDTEGRSNDPDAARWMALNAAANFGEAERWFYVRENKELRDPRKKDDYFWEDPVLQAIRRAVKGMLSGIERVYADDDPPRMKVHQKDASGLSMVLDFGQLSAGQRNLMALTVDFARRLAMTYPGWDNPLEAPGILLIDEIELNLHPRWQQTVIAHLRRVFTDTQIIVATHSPQVLSTLEARQIRVLKDGQVYVPEVQTFGSDAARVQRLVMDTDSRPPDNPFTRALEALFRQIAADDIETAEAALRKLEAERGSDDPDLIEVRMQIENRKWEKEIGFDG